MSVLERLRRLLRPGDGLEQQAVIGGVWAFLINVSSRGLGIIRLIILTWFLGPEQFGVFGIALLALSAMQSFSQLGLDRALIQREQELVDAYLDSVWVLRLARGVVIFCVGYAAAPIIADLFGEPSVLELIRILAVSAILNGLRNPGSVYFDKDLDFSLKFVQQMSGTVLNTIVAVTVAVLTGSVWALVAGTLTGSLVSTGVSYLIHEYRPGLSFDWGRAKDLVGFGKWITGSAILTFFITTADDAIVGWLLGASALGYYQLAYRLANAPATEISDVLSTTLRPTFSKIQSETDQLRDAFLQALQIVSVIALPISAGIFVTASPFVQGILGQEWTPAIVVMQAFALVAVFRAVLTPFGALFEARGRPDIATKTQAASGGLMLLVIFPAAEHYGLAGVAVVTGIRFLVSFPVVLYVGRALVGIRAGQYANVIAPPLVSSLFMTALVLLARSWTEFTPLAEFSLSLVVGVIAYLALLLALDRQFDLGIQTLVQRMKHNLS